VSGCVVGVEFSEAAAAVRKQLCVPRLVTLISLTSLFGVAQEAVQNPRADENTVEAEQVVESSKRYNLPLANGGFNFSAGLRGVYVDNVFLTETGQREDYIVVPELNIAAFFPIGRTNSIVLDLGIAYYQYLKNGELNTGIPLINPNSELAFKLSAGDFRFDLTERFSYQESPVYQAGGEFFNVYHTGRFARFDNRAGVLATWDLHDLIVSAGYYHENLLAKDSFYNYIDHASELFSADGMLALSPRLKAGLEAAASLNRFDNRPLNDSWRARVGPAFRLDLSQFFQARFGAGYERIQYDSPEASALGISGEDTYYAYGAVAHEINQFFSHSLEVFHDNQLGYNAGNLEGTHVTYTLTWRPRERLSLSPHVAVIFYKESFGSGPPTLYHESFTYILAGLTAQYQLGQHWRTSLRWDYRLKDSEFEGVGYAQNQVALEVIYKF